MTGAMKCLTAIFVAAGVLLYFAGPEIAFLLVAGVVLAVMILLAVIVSGGRS